MKYCKKCLMPNTRPGIKFIDGVCAGCVAYERQESTDWEKRWKELEEKCDEYRGSNGEYYDCAIAVSGGKDSHFQVYTIKERLGMNPVLLSIGNIDWTETGKKNLDNLSIRNAVNIIIQFTSELNKYKSEGINREIFEECKEKLILLLHPIAPHMTEELWSVLGNETSVHEISWPTYDKNAIVKDEVEIVVQVNGKVRDKIVVSASISKEDMEKEAINNEKIAGLISGKNIIKVIAIPKKLVNIVVK